MHWGQRGGYREELSSLIFIHIGGYIFGLIVLFILEGMQFMYAQHTESTGTISLRNKKMNGFLERGGQMGKGELK